MTSHPVDNSLTDIEQVEFVAKPNIGPVYLTIHLNEN